MGSVAMTTVNDLLPDDKADDFLPNDKAVCIEAIHPHHYQGKTLEKGKIYCIREVEIINGREYVKVVGIVGDLDPVSRKERVFKASRFRRINR
jgi:hypothetical protein